MLLLTSALALFAGTAVQAAVYQVAVGDGGLTYTPNSVTAAAQDTIVFTLYVAAAAVAVALPDLFWKFVAKAVAIPSLSRPSRTPALHLPVV